MNQNSIGGVTWRERCTLFALALLLSAGAHAQTTNNYTGPNNGDWNTAGNWSFGTVPANTNDVTVIAGSSNLQVRISIASATAATAGSVTLGGNGAGDSQLSLRSWSGGGSSLTVTGNITMSPGSGNSSLLLGTGYNGANTPPTLTIGGGTGSIVDGGGTGASSVNIYAPMGTLGLTNVTVDGLNLIQNTPGSLTIGSGQTYTIGNTMLGSATAGVTEALTVNGTLVSTLLRTGYSGLGSNATFTLNTGGLVQATTIERAASQTTTFNWDGGTIQNKSGGGLTVQGTGGNTLTISLAGTGTHTFEADSNRTITVQSTAVLTDKSGENGTLVKAGLGTLLFNGTNTYSGGTTISAGTLALGAAARLTNTVSIAVASNATFDVSAVTGGFTLQAGQTLTGNGLVKGATTIASNAVISPGLNGIGTLTFSNNLTFAGIWDVALSNDTINVLNIIGSLSVSNGAVLAFNVSGAQALSQYAFGFYSNALGAATNNFFLQNLNPGYAVQYDIPLGGNLYEMAVVIPEPSSSALVAGGLCLLLAFQRRRRKP